MQICWPIFASEQGENERATPMPKVVAQINASFAGWVNYFRVDNTSRAFSEVHGYLEMKVRTLLTLTPSEKLINYTGTPSETISQLPFEQTSFPFCRAVRNVG
jgi:hypothetical protein